MTIQQAWAAGRTARAARLASNPARKSILAPVIRMVVTRWPSRGGFLTLGGFGLVDYAAWQWNHTAGYAAAGLSLLALEWLSHPERGRP